MASSALSARDLSEVSDLIGSIYDCAIDPALWDPTLDAVRAALNCANATLYVFDTAASTQRLNRAVGVDPEWERLMIGYSPQVTELYRQIDAEAASVPGHIFVLRRDVTDEILFANRYFTEWALPQGIEDLIQVTLLRERGRLSLMAMGRYGRDGRIGEREIDLLSLLAPHLRRAVAISDLIDMKTLEADALAATLDLVSTGVVLVDAEGSVLHLNRAASGMLDACGLVLTVEGRLDAREAGVKSRLLAAIGEAGAAAASSGFPLGGGGVPLNSAEGLLHLAYVLPIGGGAARPRLMPRAAAAIFLTSATSPPGELGAVAEAFGLTPAETRLLHHLVAGASLDEAAAALNVARTTSRTHLGRILGKTGTRRQAALVSLIHRLVPDIRSDAP